MGTPSMNKNPATTRTSMDWESQAQVLRAMAHPVRLRILETLCEGPLCVNDLNAFVTIPQPQLSQHMTALRKAELIACHTNGPLRCYYILKPTLVRKLVRLLTHDHPVRGRSRDAVVREATQKRRLARA